MGLRERFGELETPIQIVLVLGVVVVIFVGLVAATVVGAAVVGTFVLGVGNQASSDVPQVSFTTDSANGQVTITHAGGDPIDPTRLLVRVDGSESTWATLAGTADPVEAGDEISVEADSGTEVVVVYDGPEGQRTLVQYEA